MTTDRTSYAVKTQIDAMDHECWDVGILSNKGMMNKIWTTKELIANVLWLKRQNSLSAHIYIRPDNSLPHSTILLDDLKFDDIDRLKASGYQPAVVIETSPNNHQVWIRFLNSPMSTEERTVCAKTLAKGFNGDPNSADGKHYGRLAGFTNQKPKYRVNGLQPFVKVKEALGMTCDKEFVFVEQANQIQIKQGQNITIIQCASYSLAENEYLYLINNLLKKYPEPDFSRLDFMIAERMIAKGFSVESIEDAMKKLSPNITKRKIGHLDNYVRRTIVRAASS